MCSATNTIQIERIHLPEQEMNESHPALERNQIDLVGK
jgi:hypothetical protein